MSKNLYGFTIKRATIEDIPAIQDITSDAFYRYVKESGIKGEVDALNESYEDIKKDVETKYVFIAFVNGEALGSVRVEIREDNTAYLTRFGVKSHNQNNGIGKTLMSVVDKVMKENSVKRLELHTASKYIPLVRFYYGRGFYIESVSSGRGYLRALLVKEY